MRASLTGPQIHLQLVFQQVNPRPLCQPSSLKRSLVSYLLRRELAGSAPFPLRSTVAVTPLRSGIGELYRRKLRWPKPVEVGCRCLYSSVAVCEWCAGLSLLGFLKGLPDDRTACFWTDERKWHFKGFAGLVVQSVTGSRDWIGFDGEERLREVAGRSSRSGNLTSSSPASFHCSSCTTLF